MAILHFITVPISSEGVDRLLEDSLLWFVPMVRSQRAPLNYMYRHAIK